jgi:hypothetical protein
MHPSQGSKASWLWKVRFRAKTLSNLRDIHKVGRPLVPMLWLPIEDKAKELKVQGKAQGKDKETRSQGCQSSQANHSSSTISQMDNGPNVLLSKIVSRSTGRDFFLKSIFFQNGCFIIISEGDEWRIGAISTAISTSNKVNTAKVIPSKYDSIFINTIAEKISSMINGICLISFYSKAQLQLADMKAIMEEVMKTTGSRKHEA